MGGVRRVEAREPLALAERIFPGRSEMASLIRAMDWSRTPLGPVEAWPQSLRTAVSLCLGSRHPIVLWWGPERSMFYNDAYRPMLGEAKHPQFLGGSGRECWAEIWDVIGPMMDEVIATGEATWSEDLRLLMRRNGYLEETYFTFSYSPIRDEAGIPCGIFNACTESTARVLDRRRLKTLREMSIAARSADEASRLCVEVLAGNREDIPFALVYLLDADGRHLRLAGSAGLPPGTAASPRVVEVARRPPDGWPLSDVIADGRAVRVADLHERFESLPREPWDEPPHEAMLMPIARQASTQRAGVLVLGISPRRAFDDDYAGFFDLVTEHVAAAVSNARAHEEANARAQKLTEIDRAKTTFFSNVSHEFRTPLTMILGPVEDALAAGRLEGASLKAVHRSALRLLRLVNSLLDFSRIEAGRLGSSFEATDLAVLTAGLAGAFASLVESAGLKLIVECPALPRAVYVDRSHWEKIVFNLVSNAFKFTLEGAITVRLQVRGENVELVVSDTGIGIPESEHARVFERFHRVAGARGRSVEGTGIGLALVQELVKLHGGSLRLESVVGRGTTFTVTLPLGHDHLPEEQVGPRTSGDVLPVAVPASPWIAAEVLEERIEHPPPRFAPPEAASTLEERGRILIADDNPDVRNYVVGLLAPHYAVDTAADGASALTLARETRPDLILSDVMMPGMDGFALLRALRAAPATRGIPFVFLSARAGEEAVVEGLETGADDYLLKPFSARELLSRVRAHMSGARARSSAIRASETRFRRLADSGIIGITVADASGRILEANDAFLDMVGYSREDLRDGLLDFENLTASTTGEASGGRASVRVPAHGVGRALEREYRRKDGSSVPALVAVAPLEASETLSIALDLSQRKQLEEQFRQAQRMEAIGRLASGVAHDFNNLLSVILSYAELLHDGLSEDEPLRSDVEEIRAAGTRATDLTRQLLAFSRQQVMRAKMLDLRQSVAGIEKMLRRLLGAGIDLTLLPASDLWSVRGDPGQIEQVLMNLAVNARDAMPRGGKLTIEVANAIVDDHSARVHADVTAGSYVVLTVSDTGVGMDRETQLRVFEPFFTTKESGKGTGLGLATVFGIVKQSGGHVTVESEPGKGTTFRVYFPRVSGVPDARASEHPAPLSVRGSETVLLVEDDDQVRSLARDVLRRSGYVVLEAPNGGEALLVCEQHRARIDLLLADVILPRMNGYHLAQRLLGMRPEMKVLFMSGSTDDVQRGDIVASGVAYLQKPLTPGTLTRKVWAVLRAGCNSSEESAPSSRM